MRLKRPDLTCRRRSLWKMWKNGSVGPLLQWAGAHMHKVEDEEHAMELLSGLIRV